MRVVHVIESFGGGAYNSLKYIVNGLPDFEHIVVHGIRTSTPKDFRNDFLDAKLVYWKSACREINPVKDVIALIELLKILKSMGNIDVIHLHSSKAGFLGRLAARLMNLEKKTIYTPRGLSFLRTDVSMIKRWWFLQLEKIAYRFGGKIVACSKSEAEEICRHGIKAAFVYNGVECRRGALSSIAGKTGKFVVGTVGRITYAKDPSMFNSIAEAFESESGIKFLWIGDGELRKLLVSANIEVTGWLERDELWSKLAGIDVYLSTSLWEGLPLGVLEAMCLGKPLVLSRCVGNIDTVVNGFNGFLFEEKEEAVATLRVLLSDEEMRDRLGKNSIRRFDETFSLEKMIEGYRSIYIDIDRE